MSYVADKLKEKRYFLLIYFALLLSVGEKYVIVQNKANGLSNCIIAIILATAYCAFWKMKQEHIMNQMKNKVLFFVAFFLSFILLGISKITYLGLFSLIGVGITAVAYDFLISFSIYFLLLMQYTILQFSDRTDDFEFIIFMIIGLIMCILCSQLKEKKSLWYLALILISVDGILQIVQYEFQINSIMTNKSKIIVELFSIVFIVLCIDCYIRYAKRKALAQKEEKQITEKNAIMQEKLELQHLMEPDFDLSMRLEQYSMPLFAHSMKISFVSEMAAKEVGANSLLTKCGGLFHEIGRIEDNENYVEAGLILGRKYNFPKRLLDILAQHSTAYEKPKSIEAAIVMLSDCIISTSEYLIKTGNRKKISNEHLVQSVFQNRIAKKSFENANITEKQLQILLNFYIENAFTSEE